MICKAIRERRLIEFNYKDKARVVEPHTLGYTTDGVLTLSAWQTRGGSGVGFRDFHVSLIHSLTPREEVFSGPRLEYRRDDKTLSRIVCQL